MSSRNKPTLAFKFYFLIYKPSECSRFSRAWPQKLFVSLVVKLSRPPLFPYYVEGILTTRFVDRTMYLIRIPKSFFFFLLFSNFSFFFFFCCFKTAAAVPRQNTKYNLGTSTKRFCTTTRHCSLKIVFNLVVVCYVYI